MSVLPGLCVGIVGHYVHSVQLWLLCVHSSACFMREIFYQSKFRIARRYFFFFPIKITPVAKVHDRGSSRFSMKQEGGRLLASEDALPISQSGVCGTIPYPELSV